MKIESDLQQYLPLLMRCALFTGISEEDTRKLLRCFPARMARYGRGEVIFAPGDAPTEFGIVLSGAVCGERSDREGGRSVAGAVTRGGVFGELLACALGRAAAVTVTAAEETLAVMLPFARVSGGCCENGCECHRCLTSNMFGLIGRQYFALSDRLYYLTRHTLREKLSAYLSDASRGSTKSFTVPFTREELASYLGAERSAVCRELSRMKAEGLISIRGRSFSMLKEGKELP